MTTSYIRECNTQMTTMYDMTLIPWTIFGYEVASCDVLTYLNLIHETNHFSKPNNQINWEKNNQKKRAWIVLFSNLDMFKFQSWNQLSWCNYLWLW